MLYKVLIIANVMMASYCFPDGPPISQCSSMEPLHYTTAQNGNGPYSVTSAATKYRAGEQISVTVSTTGDAFMGLLLQARFEGSDTPVGKWSAPASANFQLINCAYIASAIGHSNKILKTMETFTWTAPVSGSANVTFYATVVKSRLIYHVKIRSNPVNFEASPATATQAPSTLATQGSAAATPATQDSTSAATTSTIASTTSGNKCLSASVALLGISYIAVTLFW